MFAQEVIATLIASGAVTHVMCRTVDLDREIGARAKEIEDLGAS